MSAVPETMLNEYWALVRQINDLDHAYHVLGQSTVPDAVYDELMRRLIEFETKYPSLVLPNSPSKRVGSNLAGDRPQVTHTQPMLSLDNIFEVDVLARRLEALLENGDTDWVLEPKVDGLSISLTYVQGNLVRATTRGDGLVGEDVTAAIMTVGEVPLRLRGEQVPETVEVRGEAFINRATFDQWNARRVAAGEAPMANPRNAAVGAVMRSDSRETAKAPLRFVPYTLVGHPCQFDTYAEQKLWFTSAGFSTLKDWYARDVQTLADLVIKFNDIWRSELPFPTDGAVIKVNNLGLRKKLGASDKAPRWAFAFKYQAERAETRLNGITVQVGRLGALTPVAELDAVELAGTTIRRASLHNFDMVQALNLAVGDTVLIEKAGEIIPYVLAVTHRPANRPPFVVPDKCPVCGGAVERRQNEDGEAGVAVMCTNYQCEAQIIGRLEKWCSKEAMDLEAVGPGMVEKLVRELNVRELADLYRETLPDKLALLAGMGEKKVANFVAERDASKTRGMQAVLTGLCIPRIGNTIGKKLARRFPDLPALIAAVDGSAGLPGMGKVDFQALKAWLSDGSRCAMIARLSEAGVSLKSSTYSEKEASGPFSGQVVVFTGTLDSMERDAARSRVEELGGKTSGSVSGKTTMLVVGSEAGSKLDKARKQGIKILTEPEFLEMIKS